MNVSVKVPETPQGAQRESLFWTRRHVIHFELFLNSLKFRSLDHKFIISDSLFCCWPVVTLLLNLKILQDFLQLAAMHQPYTDVFK